ncbi:MAG: glycosyltransferase family 39 protein [Acidobacteriota bacterium]|nr:glycosyltransferase family 39 protein [Acidobacteriota bacterium]
MEVAPAIRPLKSDIILLSAFASIVLLIHFVSGNGYGFHRDELQFLDDARHLQWGYTAYPPLTAFAGRVAIALFGISPQAFRFPNALVSALSLGLLGLLARELGGRRPAQLLALFAGLPVAFLLSSVLQYNTFDYFAWGLMALFTAYLLRTGDERFWIGVGTAAGIGVLSKYSIAFPIVSLVAALLLLPSQRRHLRSRWFYFGALTALLIASPNLVWLVRHHFITLQMEHFIHLRDIRIGRAQNYFSGQIPFALLALPLAIAGLVSLLRSRRFRLLSAYYIGPLLLFALVKGRSYYMLPGYIVLYAAGSVACERFLAARRKWLRIAFAGLILVAMLTDATLFAALSTPIAHPGSPFWNWQMAKNPVLLDEIGWPQFVADVAHVRDNLAPSERVHMAVLAENYGEAGALALYGPAYGLPTPISDVNSFHDRGFGPFPSENVIVTGGDYDALLQQFESCRLAGHVHIPYGVQNEESVDHADILVCHHLRRPWSEVWPEAQHFAGLHTHAWRESAWGESADRRWTHGRTSRPATFSATCVAGRNPRRFCVMGGPSGCHFTMPVSLG